MFTLGENPPTDIAKNLLKLLYKKNVPHDHAAVQWTKEFLKTRGLDQANFDLYLKELRRIPRVKDGSATISTLSNRQIKSAKEMIWYLSGKRSWLTGEEIKKIEDSVLHHIRHKRNPWKTLYGGIYDTLPNFALVAGKQENSDVEKRNTRQHWEDTFIYMWEQFKKGNFKEATAHWDPRLQAEFLRERQTQQNLDPWLSQV